MTATTSGPILPDTLGLWLLVKGLGTQAHAQGS